MANSPTAECLFFSFLFHEIEYSLKWLKFGTKYGRSKGLTGKELNKFQTYPSRGLSRGSENSAKSTHFYSSRATFLT